jgi:hypothetical protein
MLKWVSWVFRMGATALLLSFLCIWTTGYIVNSYMETVIKQLELPLQTQPFALSGVWGKLWGAEKVAEAEASASKPANEDSNAVVSNQQETLSPDTSPDISPDFVPDKNTLPESDNSTVPDDIASPNPDSGDVDAAPVFNGQAGMGQLTDSERQTLYAMVVSKLNQEQLKLLSDSMQGGLTNEELDQVQIMLKSALTDEQYSQMMELLQGNKKPDTETISE